MFGDVGKWGGRGEEVGTREGRKWKGRSRSSRFGMWRYVVHVCVRDYDEGSGQEGKRMVAGGVGATRGSKTSCT